MTATPGRGEGVAARERLARLPALADSTVLANAAAVAHQLRSDFFEIVADVTNTLARDIDQLDADPLIVELLDASVQGNITTAIHILANDIPIDHLQPTTAAVEYALRLAQRDVPANSLVRAYHLGQGVFIRRALRVVDDMHLSAADAMAVTTHITDVVFSYIDWISLYVFQAHEDERRRWLGAEGGVLSSTIHQLLAAPNRNVRIFERETGYRLDQHHVGAILWSAENDSTELTELDRTARTIAARLNSEGPPIVTAIDRNTLWAWFGRGVQDTPIDTELVEKWLDPALNIRVALGLPMSGASGFRRSHEQARAAFAVATMPGSPTRSVVGFGDRGIAVVSLLARDIASTASWVREVLGHLAADTPAAADLRETLSVFFATRDSHVRTAKELNLHRNTVKYRVDKALAEVPPNRDHLDVALALAVCEFLGPAVIAG